MVNRHWCILCVLYLIIRQGKNSMQTSNTQDLIGQISALSTMCLAFLQHAFRLLWHFYLIKYVDVFSIHLISKKNFFLEFLFCLALTFFNFPKFVKEFTNSLHTLLCSGKNYFQKFIWFSLQFSVRVISLPEGTWNLKSILIKVSSSYMLEGRSWQKLNNELSYNVLINLRMDSAS